MQSVLCCFAFVCYEFRQLTHKNIYIYIHAIFYVHFLERYAPVFGTRPRFVDATELYALAEAAAPAVSPGAVAEATKYGILDKQKYAILFRNEGPPRLLEL